MSEELENKEAPFIEHFTELRARLIKSCAVLVALFTVCYIYSETIFNLLVEPLAENLGPDRRLIFTDLPEVFFMQMKLAFFAAFCLAFPFFSFQFYRFLAPGLYRSEKRMMIPYLVVAPVLFFLGIALAYFYIFPLAWKFFVSFENSAIGNIGLPIELEPRVGAYLKISIQIIIAFGFAFQLPLILVLLVHFGTIDEQWLKSRRRYALVILVIIAALITPPDVISLLGLFIALYLLYELSIIAARFVKVKK